MKNAIKGLLLSGLICPGLGQFLLGQKTLGIVLMTLASTGLVVYAYSLFVRLMAVFDRLQEMAANPAALPQDMLQFYVRIFAPASASDVCALILLAGTWLFSFLQAFWVGRKRDRSEHPSPK